MDNENLYETQNENEEVGEEVAEVSEAVNEAAEEITDEVNDAVAEEDAEEATEETFEEEGAPAWEEDEPNETISYEENEYFEAQKKKLSKGTVGVIAALIAIVVILGGLLCYSLFSNKYNHLGFMDISGSTIGEVCEQSGYDYEQFLADYELPSDLPKSTNMNATYSMLPIKTYAAMYYTDFATIKEGFEIPDTIPATPITIWEKIKAIFVKSEVEVTEDTPWGFALNNIKLGNVYGSNFEEAKEYYGFGDDVTTDTLYGEVRKIIETKDMEERIASDKAQAEAEKEAEKEAENNADTDAENNAEGENIEENGEPTEEGVGENPNEDKSGIEE